jgi:hypothetical protein
MSRLVKHALLVFLFGFSSFAFAEPGIQEIAPDKKLHFGQSIQEVEAVTGKSSKTNSTPFPRKEIDREITTDSMRFEFDSGLLCTMEFRDNFPFKSPLTPFRQKWMNLDNIGTNIIQPRITKRQFLGYLEVWENRAKSFGVEKVQPGDMRALNDHQYIIQVDKVNTIDPKGVNSIGFTHIAIRMGTEKKSSHGGLWENGWSIFFLADSAQPGNHGSGQLDSITALGDTSKY